jgi:hypothetical protein
MGEPAEIAGLVTGASYTTDGGYVLPEAEATHPITL